MKLGSTLYINNTAAAVVFYQNAFDLTLGYHVKNPDGTMMHAELCRDGREIFAVSESRNDPLVKLMLASKLKESRPTMCLGITFDNAAEVKTAYDVLAKEGTVLFPLGSLPWSDCCAEVVDKYGVCWYLTI